MRTHFIKKRWEEYKFFVEKNYLRHFSSGKDIDYWRAKIFMRFMLFALPIGVVIYIPSVILSLTSNLPIVAIIDTFAIAVVFLLIFNNKIGLKTKKVFLIACFYILSVVLLIFLGTLGPGLIYLLGTSIFTLLIVNTRAGYISVLVNLLIYCLLATGLLVPDLGLHFFNDYTIESWMVVGSNFLLINTLLVVAVSSLINGLQKTIANEKKLQIKLIENGAKLKIAMDKAIESDKLKSAFLANMSHEIRTPLNAIIGFAGIIHKRKSLDHQTVFIDIINKSSEQLLTLVNDIIDLSKIEAGVITKKHEKIKLIDFFNSIINPMKSLCPENLRFEYDYQVNNQNEEVILDVQKITQIVTNLITNAYKYTKSGYVKFIISISEDKKTISFVIEDSGIGISPEKQKHIFERFYQENPLSSGVGLGLAICNSLVGALHGEIHFESEKWKGTSFFVNIPIPASGGNIIRTHEQLQVESVPKNSRRLRILIAEDDESNFEMIKEILNEWNHIITRVTNGYSAISAARNEIFDVILMDIKMPDMDGLESTRQIRKFDKNIPIIAVTAYAFDADEERALEAGCNAYLSKPINTATLEYILYKYSNAESN